MYGQENKPHLGGYIVGLTDHGDPNSYAVEVWDWMYSNDIRSVIDVGCGQGHSVKYFKELGMDVIGVEGGMYAIKSGVAIDNTILHDYTEGPLNFERSYDAVWCCEFVEHIEQQYIENFLKTFDHAKYIFMTHGLPGQDGYHHVNCQPPEYWIDILVKRGFIYDDLTTYNLKNMSNKLHIKNSLLVFKKHEL